MNRKDTAKQLMELGGRLDRVCCRWVERERTAMRALEPILPTPSNLSYLLKKVVVRMAELVDNSST